MKVSISSSNGGSTNFYLGSFGQIRSIPKLLHVDGRDTCSDQEGWIKRSNSENIQSNLKGGFLRLECGAQSVVATANRTLRIRVLHHIANSDCEGLLRIRALKDIANSDTIGFIANSYAKDYLRIRVLHETGNSESIFNYTLSTIWSGLRDEGCGDREKSFWRKTPHSQLVDKIFNSFSCEGFCEDVCQLILRIDKVKFNHPILNMLLDKVKSDVYMLRPGMLNIVAFEYHSPCFIVALRYRKILLTV
ncbi:hypothetical protein Tco_1288875, partial [Tanacetum coccineum]